MNFSYEVQENLNTEVEIIGTFFFFLKKKIFQKKKNRNFRRKRDLNFKFTRNKINKTNV